MEAKNGAKKGVGLVGGVAELLVDEQAIQQEILVPRQLQQLPLQVPQLLLVAFVLLQASTQFTTNQTTIQEGDRDSRRRRI
jgi:hypothetical protein